MHSNLPTRTPVRLALLLWGAIGLIVADLHTACTAQAAEPVKFPGQSSDWNGFVRYDFEIAGQPVLVVTPQQSAEGLPWIWHGEFFGHKPQPDIELLRRGWHVVYLKVPNLLGSPIAVNHWNRCYEELTTNYGLARKVGLVGLSRGGLYCYNWAAANPDKVACIYGDAPVCDFKSWPGGKGAGPGSPRDWQLVLETYGFPDEAAALAYRKNPVDNLAPLAEHKIPLLHVYGDADEVVPWEENTGLLAQRYRELGGQITLILKPGVKHHPHGLDHPEPIVEFLAHHTSVAAHPDTRSESVRAMEQRADLSLVPPMLNTSPLPKYDYDQLDYGMTIGIERTPNGRLWACWVAGGDSPKAFFVFATSDDQGETWSKPRLVIDTHTPDLPEDRSILVGNLWTDPLGRLWAIFDQSMDMFDGRAGVWVAMCENPDADEPKWSAPRRIWHGVTLNKPTVLSTGEWMLPISLDQRTGFRNYQGCFANLDPYRGANVFVSADQGKTWERRGAVRFPNPDWHEHMIVERKDGSLWMLARMSKGIMQSTSTDGGRTWAEPTEPDGIRQPNARFHLRRLASGRILLIKHGTQIDAHAGRVGLSAWLSDDDGHTWQGGLMLDERKGISYPDGFQAPDGTIYISYDRNRSTDGEILLARFTENDVLQKQLTGPASKLQLLISKPLKNSKPRPE